jgi:hypothetical protein
MNFGPKHFLIELFKPSFILLNVTPVYIIYEHEEFLFKMQEELYVQEGQEIIIITMLKLQRDYSFVYIFFSSSKMIETN